MHADNVLESREQDKASNANEYVFLIEFFDIYTAEGCHEGT